MAGSEGRGWLPALPADCRLTREDLGRVSYHIHIAFEGFKETPIPLDAWLAAARQCDDVVVEEQAMRSAEIHYSVHLKADKRAWLDRTPYGLIEAQDPSRELVEAMFKLADALNAGVYSERLKRFRSVDDWERRTRRYRRSLEERRAKYGAARRARIVLWVVYLAAAAALGVLASTFGWFKGGR